MITSIVGVIDTIAQLGIQIFKRSNNKEARRYSGELAELKTKLNNELRKPMDQWIHSDIEKMMDRINVISALAMSELNNVSK